MKLHKSNSLQLILSSLIAEQVRMIQEKLDAFKEALSNTQKRV